MKKTKKTQITLGAALTIWDNILWDRELGTYGRDLLIRKLSHLMENIKFDMDEDLYQELMERYGEK